jgi:hypothetical protein
MSLLMPHQRRLLEEILHRGVEVSPECLVGLAKMRLEGIEIRLPENFLLRENFLRNVGSIRPLIPTVF